MAHNLTELLKMTIIRVAQARDAEALLVLAKTLATSFVVDSKAFRVAFSELLSSPSGYLAIAEVDKDIVGYILGFDHYTFYANGRVAWVEEIIVDADYRKMGIGRSLMQSFEGWATDRDAKLVALATRRAGKFYKALGYEESATYWRKLL
ncbi:MAG: GNAT family N-acetyltransferase [Nostoc sp.]|uniref:GNAT family N-acetyltransferase n=1 Tax=Nostoc sp. TaxID=1180 RepID=UPI002FFCB0F4